MDFRDRLRAFLEGLKLTAKQQEVLAFLAISRINETKLRILLKHFRLTDEQKNAFLTLIMEERKKDVQRTRPHWNRSQAPGLFHLISSMNFDKSEEKSS